MTNKYNINDRVLVEINLKNRRKKKVKVTIYGIEFDSNTNIIRYKIHIESNKYIIHDGYVIEDKIVRKLNIRGGKRNET